MVFPLLLWAAGMKSQVDAGKRRRKLEDEERAYQKKQRDFTDQFNADRLEQLNAPKDYFAAIPDMPGAPGYNPAPEVPMFPGMPTDITTGGGGRYAPGSPMPGPPPPLQQAGPAATPWTTEEEAAMEIARKLSGKPYAMNYGIEQARNVLPSRDEVETRTRRQELQGREDVAYNQTIDVKDASGNKQTIFTRDLDNWLKTNPGALRVEASKSAVDAHNAVATQYGAPLVMQGATWEELQAASQNLKDFREAKEYTRTLEAPTQGAKALAGYQDSLKGMPYMAPAIPPLQTQSDFNRPVAPMPERFQTMPGLPGGPVNPPPPAPKAPLPREMRSTPDREPSRMGFASYLAGQNLSPEAFELANEQMGDEFNLQDKMALEAAKRETPIYEYFLDENGQPVKIQTGVGTATEATTALRESLKALEVPTNIEKTKAIIAYTEAGTEYRGEQAKQLIWKRQETEKMDDFLISHKTEELTLAKDKLGLDREAFNEKVRQYKEAYTQKLADTKYENEYEQYTDQADLALRNVAELRGFMDAAMSQIDTLVKTNFKKDGTYMGAPGQQKVVQNKIDSLRSGVTTAYKLYKGQVLTSGGNGTPPAIPIYEGAPPPLTGTPTGLPTIDPKAERTRVYGEAAAAAKTAKIKDATTGKMRSLTPQEQKQLINTIMSNRGLI